jgi:hypothetical protein
MIEASSSGNGGYDVVIESGVGITATEGIFDAIASSFDSQKPVNVNVWEKGIDSEGHPCFWRLNVTQIINAGERIFIVEDSGGTVTLREDGWVNYYKD